MQLLIPNGDSTDILYRLIGVSFIKNRAKPVYSAVNKKGSRTAGVSFIEHNTETSVIRGNNLAKPALLTINLEAFKTHHRTANFTKGALVGFSAVNGLGINVTTYSSEEVDNAMVDVKSTAIDDTVADAIGNAIETGDYDIGYLESALDDIGGVEDTRRNTAISDYAEILMAMVDQLVPSGDVTTIKRAEEYLSKYVIETEDPESDEAPKSKSSTAEDQSSQISSMDEITNHSGGAYGADTMWDVVGRTFGVINHNHYRDSGNTSLSKQLRDSGVSAVSLTPEQMEEGYAELERVTGRTYERTLANNLKARNFFQVKNADAVFAIATSMADKNGRAGTSSANKGVSGGTNAAVQMAIAAGKPVYVYDLGSSSWMRWNGDVFENTETPILTKNFAGIGSRDIDI